MNIIDYIILGILLLGALIGFKKGILNSLVTFLGMILVIILAFYLKNPISELMYEYLPFFDFNGKFEGVKVLNIILYEGISFAITLSLLSIILSVIVKISGIFNKLVNATILLGFPSKILGAIVGLIEGYLVSFVLIFILSLISTTSPLVNESKYADTLIRKTPVLSSYVVDSYNSIVEVYDICVRDEEKEDKTAANLESLGVLLKYKVISVESADKLVDSEKLNIEGAKDVIDIYRKDRA